MHQGDELLLHRLVHLAKGVARRETGLASGLSPAPPAPAPWRVPLPALLQPGLVALLQAFELALFQPLGKTGLAPIAHPSSQAA
ncbi:hypothetical protein C1C92_22465 [Aeromonas caviae]|uniref:hypothetical protein n=1 Tax=Aeromonas caviae TaxID=648 RepID=UPI0013AFBB0D|nr:hypothetical protein [Aeromonas caviae]QLI59464.1 hypothetical protein C1C92_22465 [Aeromonas caviae]